ncbi:hypothetical protein M0813_28906 [Anaeramoeba flamelloides]|uniref:RING-type domain-containing protein n=1 Tax=Anaeramoeba flamelloides TaxID=1746091 RepID=A0ABQ8XU90_9EUKA|nr:hypothetical protein M0813_28906 [Anaeramoeba flamelloides]
MMNFTDSQANNENVNDLVFAQKLQQEINDEEFARKLQSEFDTGLQNNENIGNELINNSSNSEIEILYSNSNSNSNSNTNTNTSESTSDPSSIEYTSSEDGDLSGFVVGSDSLSEENSNNQSEEETDEEMQNNEESEEDQSEGSEDSEIELLYQNQSQTETETGSGVTNTNTITTRSRRRNNIQQQARQTKITSKNLPTQLFNKNSIPNEIKSCTICLMDYKNNEELKTLPCLHIFHTQ